MQSSISLHLLVHCSISWCHSWQTDQCKEVPLIEKLLDSASRKCLSVEFVLRGEILIGRMNVIIARTKHCKGEKQIRDYHLLDE